MQKITLDLYDEKDIAYIQAKRAAGGNYSSIARDLIHAAIRAAMLADKLADKRDTLRLAHMAVDFVETPEQRAGALQYVADIEAEIAALTTAA
jgi:hypothetical protein